MLRRSVVFVCAVLGTLGLMACAESGAELSYPERVTQDRVQRDMEMRGKNSVLPVTQRESFQGLNYYDVDSAYRFTVPLDRQANPDTVMMAESTGGLGEQIRVGTVEIPFDRRTEELMVLKVKEGAERGQLWIPFTDSTNGVTTYTSGRYVDLQPAGPDSVVVDFNRAYNPTCAYNPRYACPLPPRQNHISFPVPVGEKKPAFRG